MAICRIIYFKKSFYTSFWPTSPTHELTFWVSPVCGSLPCWTGILCCAQGDKDGLQCPAPAAAKSPQSCPTLCDRIDSSPPGSPVPGILQARTLEWVAISFSHAWKWKVKMKSLSRVGLQPTRLLRPWDFPGKSTGVGCHCLLRILVSVIKDNRV